MRLSGALLVTAVCLFAAATALPSAVDFSHTTMGSPSRSRSLRSATAVEQHDEGGSQENEERGNILTVLDDIINPKTIEQLLQRAARERTDEFYENLLHNKVFRDKMFINWKRDGVDKAQVLHFLDVDKRTAKEFVDIVDAYEAFR